MPIAITFTGPDLAKLDKRLATLSRPDAFRVLEKPLLESATPWVRDWKVLAPQPGRSGYTGPGKGRRQTGKGLADVIQAKVTRRHADMYVYVLTVGADYSNWQYEHNVEWGHKIIIGRQGQQTRLASGRYTRKKTATPEGKHKRSGGRVRGGFYGKAAGAGTERQRSEILLREVGKAIDRMVETAMGF